MSLAKALSVSQPCGIYIKIDASILIVTMFKATRRDPLPLPLPHKKIPQLPLKRLIRNLLSTSPFSYVLSEEWSQNCGTDSSSLTLFIHLYRRGALSSVLLSPCYPDADLG